MSQTDKLLRDKIIAQPEIIIDDQEIMNALVAATDQRIGHNIFDLRTVAMDRLEQRIERLESTHREIIGTAYDNQASTGQIHRAVLALLRPDQLDDFVSIISHDLTAILQVDTIRLILETTDQQTDTQPHQGEIVFADPGIIPAYLTGSADRLPRYITLRQTQGGDRRIYGKDGDLIQSEACLLLTPGDDTPFGMVVMGSQNPQKFSPGMGTDLLTFLAQVITLRLTHFLS